MAATKLSVYNHALALLGETRLATITDDVEARHVLDELWDEAVIFVLRQAPWHHALKTAALIATTGTLAGYTAAYSRPADWLRTHALFVLADTRECPVDIREQGNKFYTNTPGGAYIRYVSSDYIDPALASNPWPEHFAHSVAAYLAFLAAERITGDHGAVGRMSDLFASLLPEAARHDAREEDRWLPHQRSGNMLRAALAVLSQGAWNFAIKTAAATAGGTPITGYSNAFTYPADWLRTHALYTGSAGREFPFDVREQDAHWYANVAAFTVRYVASGAASASTTWPEAFQKAVLAFLDAEGASGDGSEQAKQTYAELLAVGLQAHGVPADPWLPHQRSGDMLRAALAVLSQGSWNFALKTAGAASGGTPIAGYSNAFTYPADWLRTHALYVAASGRESPFDVREQDTHWYANVAAFTVRYVASGAASASTTWPEAFQKAVLAFLDAEGASGEALDRAKDTYAELLAAGLAAHGEKPNKWLRHQLDGSFLRAAREVLRTGAWHFAQKTSAPAESGTPSAGYAYSFPIPTDHLLTVALFTISGTTGREYPFDVREHGAFWSANVTPIQARYVSTAGLDATLWPEPFMKAVLAFIELEEAKGEAAEKAAALYKSLIAEGLSNHGDPPNPWLTYQLDGSFLRATHAVLDRGYWVFKGADGVMYGLQEIQIDESSQLIIQPDYGFPFRYALPADHFKTHALFVPWDGLELPINIRESAHDWSTDAGALTPPPGSVGSFVARYVSTDVLNPQTWPELISKAVLAYADWQAAAGDAVKVREAEFGKLISEALIAHSRPEDPWLRHQLSGRYQHGLQQAIESGRWRFAIRTVSLTESTDPLPAELSDGTASAGYTYRFIRPNDSLRTMRVYYQASSGVGAEELDVDFRDEAGALHASYTPLVVRYVSRLGLDATKWPALFRDALLAYLEYLEARADPGGAAIAQARLDFYNQQMSRARMADERRDRVPVRDVGRFVRGRMGGGSSASRTQQGYWNWP